MDNYSELIFIAFLIPVIEIILQNMFYKPIFSIGIPLFEKTIQIPAYNFPRRYNKTYTQEEAKFRFDENLVYFQSRMLQFKMFRSNSSLPFRGIGVINADNTIDIQARAPIGFLIFGLLFLSVGYFTSGELNELMNDIYVVGFFTLIVFIAIGISYFIEQKRFNKSCEELSFLVSQLNRSEVN